MLTEQPAGGEYPPGRNRFMVSGALNGGNFFLGQVDMEQEQDEERAPEIGMQPVGDRFRKDSQCKWRDEIRGGNSESRKEEYNRYSPEEPYDKPFYIAVFHSDTLNRSSVIRVCPGFLQTFKQKMSH